MALESYGVDASYWFRKFLLIPYDLRADLKILSAFFKYGRQLLLPLLSNDKSE
jgi:hypothetical protein